MKDGRVCVAALQGTRQIRLAKPQPTEQWLETIGGLEPGMIVKVDWRALPVDIRPHVEDGVWNPGTFRKVDNTSSPGLEERLEHRKTVLQAFGKPLYFAKRGNPAFSPGTGTRSLATVLAKRVRFSRVGERIRADFEDFDGSWTMVPVEDLRLWQHARKCTECRGSAFDRALAREMSGEEVLLRIGLGRPFRPLGRPYGCYLQVNSIVWPPSEVKHLFGEPIVDHVTV
jgi:hypothetical protein